MGNALSAMGDRGGGPLAWSYDLCAHRFWCSDMARGGGDQAPEEIHPKHPTTLDGGKLPQVAVPGIRAGPH